MHAIDTIAAADILGGLPRRLHELIDQHVAESARPRSSWVEALPAASTGKTLKQRLCDAAAAAGRI